MEESPDWNSFAIKEKLPFLAVATPNQLIVAGPSTKLVAIEMLKYSLKQAHTSSIFSTFRAFRPWGAGRWTPARSLVYCPPPATFPILPFSSGAVRKPFNLTLAPAGNLTSDSSGLISYLGRVPQNHVQSSLFTSQGPSSSMFVSKSSSMS
jgi:hypothetical protein